MSLLIPWQLPNATEAFAAEQMVTVCGEYNAHASYFPFPWASLIDRLRRGLSIKDSLPWSQNLGHLESVINVTVCQHIWALDHLDLFHAAGITDLFWSHATTGCQLVEGIRIHPFPLYPVRCSTHPPTQPQIAPWKRPFLYSFQGAYSAGLYLTPVRDWILKLPGRPDSLLERRGEWHYEQEVYREQVLGQATDVSRAAQLGAEASAYAQTLQQSCFALCPSGSGPNSIRLWEALGYGAIPVVLSDKLLLPGDSQLWLQAALFVAETEDAVRSLPTQLEALAANRQQLASMQAAGQELWKRYGLGCFVPDVQALLQDPHGTLLNRSLGRCVFEPWILETRAPSALPLQVMRLLRRGVALKPGQPLLIQILDEATPELLELRWRVPLRIVSELLVPRPWLVSSTNPCFESPHSCGIH